MANSLMDLNLLTETIEQYEFFDSSYFGNSVSEYLFAIVLFFSLLFIFGFIRKLVLLRFRKFSEKSVNTLDDTVVRVFENVSPPLYFFIIFYLATHLLTFSSFVQSMLDLILIVGIIFQITSVVGIVIEFLAEKRFSKDEEGAHSAAHVIKLLTQALLVVIGFLFILSNFGINITSLIAGLGIGGIAIAFALQNILGDLFSSFAILFDKPFKEGDFIIVGDKMGTVEKVGIKTTRVKALQGEQLIFSNQELTAAQIQNYAKMKRRRIVFSFRIVHNTPSAKLKKIPSMIEKILDEIENATFDRAHFKSFEDSTLVFEVVYHVEVPEYTVYMDIQQEINLAIKARLEKEKIEFAYPTRTVYIHK